MSAGSLLILMMMLAEGLTEIDQLNSENIDVENNTKRSMCSLPSYPSQLQTFTYIRCRQKQFGYVARSGRWGRQPGDDVETAEPFKRKSSTECLEPSSAAPFNDYLDYVKCRQDKFGYVNLAGRSGRAAAKRGGDLCVYEDNGDGNGMLQYMQCLKDNYGFVATSGRWGRSVSKRRTCDISGQATQAELIEYFNCLGSEYKHVSTSGRWGKRGCALPPDPTEEQLSKYFKCMNKDYRYIATSGRWGKRSDCEKPNDESKEEMAKFLDCLNEKYGHITISGRWGRSVEKRGCKLNPNADDSEMFSYMECLKEKYGHVIPSGRWGRSVTKRGCTLEPGADEGNILEYMKCMTTSGFVAQSGRWGRSVRMKRASHEHDCTGSLQHSGGTTDGYANLIRCLRGRLGYVGRSGRWG